VVGWNELIVLVGIIDENSCSAEIERLRVGWKSRVKVENVEIVPRANIKSPDQPY